MLGAATIQRNENTVSKGQIKFFKAARHDREFRQDNKNQ